MPEAEFHATAPSGYVGRFAPSPTGPLHAGSLVAALASHLDARAHRGGSRRRHSAADLGGRWLLRIEDLDSPREVPGAVDAILGALKACGLRPDGPVEYQSHRQMHYQHAFDRLRSLGLVYPCACSRKEIEDSLTRAGQGIARHAERVYRGTCRHGLPPGRAPRAWRLRVEDTIIAWTDRRAGAHREELATSVGDFVLRRADGAWAYQLAAVVDDALQGVTDVVRGMDLLASTARQVYLQRLLGLPTPRYLHVPLVLSAQGDKLSKQTGAPAIDHHRPMAALRAAAAHLGLGAIDASEIASFLDGASLAWRAQWCQEKPPRQGIDHAPARTSPPDDRAS